MQVSYEKISVVPSSSLARELIREIFQEALADNRFLPYHLQHKPNTVHIEAVFDGVKDELSKATGTLRETVSAIYSVSKPSGQSM